MTKPKKTPEQAAWDKKKAEYLRRHGKSKDRQELIDDIYEPVITSIRDTVLSLVVAMQKNADTYLSESMAVIATEMKGAAILAINEAAEEAHAREFALSKKDFAKWLNKADEETREVHRAMVEEFRTAVRKTVSDECATLVGFEQFAQKLEDRSVARLDVLLRHAMNILTPEARRPWWKFWG